MTHELKIDFDGPGLSPVDEFYTTVSSLAYSPTPYPSNELESGKKELIADSKTSLDGYCIDPVKERRLLWKIDARILLISIFIFLLCFIDRVNIANARVLNHDEGHSIMQTLPLSNSQFNIANVVCIISWSAFETPSNILLKKFRPSRWMAFLMLSWGAVTLAHAAVHDYKSLYALRFLLGAAEAGVFPGLVYFLTFWYKPSERLLRIAIIFATATAAGAFGGALAYGIGNLDGLSGLEGWRWLFILEGLPCCVCAVLVFLIMPDFPETAKWLSPEEKELAVKRLQGLASTKAAKVTWAEAKKTLRDWRLYFHYVSYICIAAPFASIALFSPSIVGGLGYEGLRAQLFTIPPYATAYLVTLCVALSAERYNARSLHASACMLAGSLGFLIQAILPPASFKARYAMLCLAAAGTFSSIPQLLAWLTINLHSTAAIGLAVALNITFSGPGQVVGTWIYRQSDAPRYRSGHLINFAVLLFGAVVVQGLRLYYVWKNKRLAAGQIPFLL